MQCSRSTCVKCVLNTKCPSGTCFWLFQVKVGLRPFGESGEPYNGHMFDHALICMFSCGFSMSINTFVHVAPSASVIFLLPMTAAAISHELIKRPSHALAATCASVEEGRPSPPLKSVLRSCHISHSGLQREEVLAWPSALRGLSTRPSQCSSPAQGLTGSGSQMAERTISHDKGSNSCDLTTHIVELKKTQLLTAFWEIFR